MGSLCNLKSGSFQKEKKKRKKKKKRPAEHAPFPQASLNPHHLTHTHSVILKNLNEKKKEASISFFQSNSIRKTAAAVVRRSTS
jgi:hypothetical protein